ncbi:MAG: helix-turn-helix domain containing protein, partial [Syntrophomonadaceae bacterium]|nr:helix-turn-helix domain containing protein [Syntrophomonadaceae bacterium]
MERKKEETKQKTISVGMNLFTEQGFDATTMEQIARHVDIAKGTLYNYFPVKEAILGEYIQRSFQARSSSRIMNLRKMPDTESRMISVLSELIEGVQGQKEIFEKYLVYQIRNMISLHRDAGVK